MSDYATYLPNMLNQTKFWKICGDGGGGGDGGTRYQKSFLQPSSLENHIYWYRHLKVIALEPSRKISTRKIRREATHEQLLFVWDHFVGSVGSVRGGHFEEDLFCEVSRKISSGRSKIDTKMCGGGR